MKRDRWTDVERAETMELRSQRLFLALILTQVAHFEAGTKGIVAPRVKVTLGQATTVCLVMKNGQLVLE